MTYVMYNAIKFESAKLKWRRKHGEKNTVFRHDGSIKHTLTKIQVTSTKTNTSTHSRTLLLQGVDSSEVSDLVIGIHSSC